jgi:hypothetical protein
MLSIERDEELLAGTWAEKMEVVFQCYLRVQDLETALTLSALSPEEHERARIDAQLIAQIQIADASDRADIIKGIIEISEKARNEGTRLAAYVKRGELTWPEKFSKAQKHEISGAIRVTWEEVENASNPA